jgi:hypothetical protein
VIDYAFLLLVGKEVSSRLEALELLFEYHLYPECSELGTQEFRDKLYWNEECDLVLKGQLTLLNYLFKTYGGTHKMPGEKM